eukprot:19368-Rhodomonas_salina.3
MQGAVPMLTAMLTYSGAIAQIAGAGCAAAAARHGGGVQLVPNDGLRRIPEQLPEPELWLPEIERGRCLCSQRPARLALPGERRAWHAACPQDARKNECMVTARGKVRGGGGERGVED